MTIDKKKLVDLLVEKTSMGRDEVEAQLDQLIERILDAAKRGKALEIKEFGVFYFDEGGELRFEASDELSTEISFKYAGMKPVELKPERDSSIPEDIEDDEDDDLQEAGVSKMEGQDDEEDLFADPFGEPDTDESEEESESVFGIEEPEEDEDSPFDFDEEDTEEQEEDEDIIADPFSEEALKPLEEPVEREEEQATNIEDIKPTASRRPVKKKDNTGIFILIAIVVIAALIGAYFFYISPQPQSSVESTQSSSAQMGSGMSESNDGVSNGTDPANTQADGQQTAQNQERSSTEQAGANQGTEEEIVSDNGVQASQTNQDMYGLMGTVIEQANDGYSIVVHSFRNEQNAREAANQLRTDGGYRVIVNSRTVYDNQVWRVSVGQFETLGDAQQATIKLPDPYSTQNFIQRIRTN